MGGIALNQLDSSININNNSGGAMDTITEENYESKNSILLLLFINCIVSKLIDYF